MTDQDERMTARHKEDTGFSETVDLHDTEVAADTWTRAALTDGEAEAKRRIEYDPYTQTERYTGELVGEEVEQTGMNEERSTEERPLAASTVRDNDVEAAAEIAEPIPRSRRIDNEIDGDPKSGAKGIGITGLVLSILSLFMWPYLLGIVGIVLGIVAYRRDAKMTGVWAIVLGAAGILGALVIYPYFTTR